MSGAKFHILGPLEVIAGGQPVDLGSPKQRAVLAILALEPNRAVSVDRLLDLLWGEDPPTSALGSLHAYISNLRRALEPDRAPRASATVLVSRAPGYLLSVESEQLDSLQFEQFAAAGGELLRTGDATGAIRELERALGLWRGPVLADFAYEMFVVAAAERLEELRRSAAEDLIDARLLLGQHAAVIAELEELVRAAPLRERAWGQLIVALYRSGRQADALRAYQRARSVLAEELGLDPGPELKRLEQAVLEQDPELDWRPGTLDDTAQMVAQAHVAPGAAVAAEDTADTVHAPVPIGRDEQLQRIDHLLSRLRSGQGGVLLVSGEPGVGKTTILGELARRAGAAGCTVGWGESQEGGTSSPLEAWAEALRHLDTAGSPPLDVTPLLSGDRQGAQGRTVARLVDQALNHIRETAAHGPLVIILDDIQWADELTHELLQRVIRIADSAPLLIALGVREPVDDPAPKLIETRAALARLPALERFALTGLDQSGVDALTHRVAGETAAPEVVRAMYERTGGNPFFVTELARLLSAQHALADADRMARSGVPVGARDVVRRRLARLPEQAVVMLGVASVLGAEVDIRLLQMMTGISIDELLDLMDLATVASLASEDPDRPGVYRFCHDLVREAIYDTLPGMRRARLHEKAVSCLIELHGDIPTIAHELARHSVRAVPAVGPEQAIPRLIASVRVAQLQMSMDLAESQLRLGLSVLAGAPPTPERTLLQADLEGRLAQLRFLIRADVQEATERIQRAYELCADNDPARHSWALMQLGTLTALWGDIHGAVKAGEQAAALARSRGDEQGESDSEYCVAFGAWSGDLASARRAIDASIEQAQRLQDKHGRPTAHHVPLPCKLAWRSVLQTIGGEVEAASAQEREAVSLAGRVGIAWDLSWTAGYVGLSAALRGDSTEVLSLWPDVAERSAGLAYTDSLLAACRAWAVSDIPGLAEARSAQEAAGAGLTLVPLAMLEADLRRKNGDLDGALALLQQTRQAAEARGHLVWLPEINRIAANVAADRGDLEVAAEQLASAIKDADEAGLGLFAGRARHDLDDLLPRLVDAKSS